jgi:hypothetical protein
MDERSLPPNDTARAPSPANPWDVDSTHEIALRELLRSPLDEPRRARGNGRRRLIAVAIFLVAAAAGAGLTVAGAALAGGSTATTVASTTTTTTTAPIASGPALPPGYYPLGEGFGARVERVLMQPGATLVTISFALDEDHMPAEGTPHLSPAIDGDSAVTRGHQGGQWVLEFPDGDTVSSLGVSFDPIAPGTATITFPPSAHDPSLGVLRLVSAFELHTATFSVSVPGTLAALPPVGTMAVELAQTTFSLDDDGTLLVGSLSLGLADAYLEWSVEGDALTAHVSPLVTLESPTTAVSLILADPFAPFRNRIVSAPLPPLATAGRADLVALDPTHRDPGTDFTVTVDLLVEWGVTGPADATIPVAGAVVVDAADAG